MDGVGDFHGSEGVESFLGVANLVAKGDFVVDLPEPLGLLHEKLAELAFPYFLDNSEKQDKLVGHGVPDGLVHFVEGLDEDVGCPVLLVEVEAVEIPEDDFHHGSLLGLFQLYPQKGFD